MKKDEYVALLMHVIWSEWMDYLFSRTTVVPDGRLIPQEFVERWSRQKDTPYEQLSDDEKASDLRVARRAIKLVRKRLLKDIDDYCRTERIEAILEEKQATYEVGNGESLVFDCLSSFTVAEPEGQSERDGKNRVYIAGPYNAPNIVDSLDNMRRGMQAGYAVLKMGMAPFVPWFDFHFSLMGEMSAAEYYEYSLAWLRVSDAVLLLPGWRHSKGTLMEIEVAKELKIPIFESLEALQGWKCR